MLLLTIQNKNKNKNRYHPTMLWRTIKKEEGGGCFDSNVENEEKEFTHKIFWMI
jgi:hypothetical protein